MNNAYLAPSLKFEDPSIIKFENQLNPIYPLHINSLLNAISLNTSNKQLISILTSFSFLTEKDIVLKEIYENLGWNKVSKKFENSFEIEEILFFISKNYLGKDQEDKLTKIMRIYQLNIANSNLNSVFPFTNSVGFQIFNKSLQNKVNECQQINHFGDNFLTNSAKALYNTKGVEDELSFNDDWGVKNLSRKINLINHSKIQQENKKINVSTPQNMTFNNSSKYIHSKEESFKHSNDFSDYNRQIKEEKIARSSKTLLSTFEKIKVKKIKKNVNLSSEESKGINQLYYGLKNISRLVKKTVKNKKTTNYKEISDLIVSKININKKLSTKEEKNIRRRIYDSLNVMKAMNMFKNSQNRSIIWNEDYNDNQSDSEKGENPMKIDVIQSQIKSDFSKSEIIQDEEMFIEEIDGLINKKKENIVDKNQRILKLIMKKNFIDGLISSNKDDTLTQDSEKIHFPFLIIEIPDKPNNIASIVSNENKSQLYLSFNDPFEINGDLDSLIKIHSRSCNHQNEIKSQSFQK